MRSGVLIRLLFNCLLLALLFLLRPVGLVLCETESHSVEELANIALPPWAATEVTSDPFFNGGNLSCVERVELAEKIHALRTIG